MAATATLRGVLRGDGPAAAACLQRGLARCGVVSLGSASSSGGSPIPWDGRGLEGLKHANGADASRPFATLVGERSACAWPSGSRAGHHSLQFTRSFKSRKSFYWPNIKKQWDRETPPELETLQVPDLPEEYTVTGTFSDKYKKPEGRETEVFAVFELGGKQYKVCPNDLVFVDSRGDLEVNDMIECNRVLLLGSKDETIIGRPYVPGTSVVAAVESQFMEAKKIVFKKKRRSNYRRNGGFRHRLTRLRILSVNGVAPGGEGA
ncbi:mitochondrial ribosomal protein L21 [Chloropicon roscoffensis]|uniref:Large ribosomal subunit protein bL21m n=1 Tax=Chloropicon roscoffensis TaxID=1461544 RepID=A0AAX4P998_9CHLO